MYFVNVWQCQQDSSFFSPSICYLPDIKALISYRVISTVDPNECSLLWTRSAMHIKNAHPNTFREILYGMGYLRILIKVLTMKKELALFMLTSIWWNIFLLWFEGHVHVHYCHNMYTKKTNLLNDATFQKVMYITVTPLKG